jgi:hypothetical protein
MFGDLEFVENERKRMYASHDHAVMMAREHGKAIISPRSSLTYTCFGMILGAIVFGSCVHFVISSLNLSNIALQIIFCTTAFIGGFIGLFVTSNIFCVDESLGSGNMIDQMKKSRDTVRSTYFK